MKHCLIALLIFSLGILCCFLSIEFQMDHISDNYDFSYEEFKNFNTGYLFLDIFLNNLLVGFLLSFLGFLTGGILSAIILFWNGYILGIIYNAAFLIVPLSDIIYSSKHVPVELYALITFATLGFQGFHFCKALLAEGKIYKEYIPHMKKFILPVISLLIASILETL